MPNIKHYKCRMITRKQFGESVIFQTTNDVSQWLPELDRLLEHFNVIKTTITIQTNDGGVSDFIVEKKKPEDY